MKKALEEEEDCIGLPLIAILILSVVILFKLCIFPNMQYLDSSINIKCVQTKP